MSDKNDFGETPPTWAKALDVLGDDAPSPKTLRRAHLHLNVFRFGVLRWLLPLLMLAGLALIAWLSTPARAQDWLLTATMIVLPLNLLVFCAYQPRSALAGALVGALVLVLSDVHVSNGWQIGTDCSAMVMLAAFFPLVAFVAYSRRENLNFPPAIAAAVAAASGLGGAVMLHVYCGATAWQHLLFFHFGAVVLLAAAAALWAARRRT